MRPARLILYQKPRNPSPHERRILTLLVQGQTPKEAAIRLGLARRSLTNALGHMRERYAARTNATLIAIAIRLQWIDLAIDLPNLDP
jgi:DNA-binding CsgD family transcriptional regulator